MWPAVLTREHRRDDPSWQGQEGAGRAPAPTPVRRPLRRLVRRRELRYGSWEFRAASDLARRLPYSPGVWALVGSVLRDPALIRVFLAVWRLPVVSLHIRQADADAWSGAYANPVGRTISGGRRAHSVLELPTVQEHHLSGRAKQALRTNLRHARNLGVTSSRIPSYEEWMAAAGVVLDARPDGPEMARELDKPGPGQQVAYYVARDADEVPLAFARVALLGQFAVLYTMLSNLDRHPSASFARYQLHTFLALDLGCAGVEHLLVGSALRESAGNQYFQHLLGYRVRNLRLEVIESGGS